MKQYKQEYAKLQRLLKRLQYHYGASSKFNRNYYDFLGRNPYEAPNNLHNNIIAGYYNFTGAWQSNLGKAIEIAQQVLHQYEPQNIHITQQADWVELSQQQVKEFMLNDIRLSLERLPSTHPKEEKRNTENLIFRFRHEEKLLKKIYQSLTTHLSLPIVGQVFKENIITSANQKKVWERMTISFPTGHTATAALFFYLTLKHELNWSLDYNNTHSVYLQKAIKENTVLPEILVLADSLTLSLLKEPKLRVYKTLGHLWRNEITVLGTNPLASIKEQFKPLRGDIYYNLSYHDSGAHLLFQHYQENKQINQTLKAQHTNYEKALEILQTSPKNFVITNDTQARLYESFSSIHRIPMLSYFTDNLILYKEPFFSGHKREKNNLLQGLRIMIYQALHHLQWSDDSLLEELIIHMMNDKNFLFPYLLSKSIKLQP